MKDHSNAPNYRSKTFSNQALRTGKKELPFIGDVGAGERSAVLYSLPGSCLRRGINPREYLYRLFGRLPMIHSKDHATLTPAPCAARVQLAAATPEQNTTA